MKTILILLFSLSFVIPVLSQDDPYSEPVMSKKEIRQFAKEKRIARKMAEEEEMKKIVSALIYNQQFVLEADYIAGRSGARQLVNSRLNFIIVDTLEGTVQIGSNNGLGYNGVGGITIEGSISRYEVIEKITKRGTKYIVDFQINSTIGNFDIYIIISPNGDAEATVRGHFSGSISYSGRIIPLRASKIYKGMAY